MEPDLYRRQKVALAIWIGAITITAAMIPLGLLSDTETSLAHLRTPSVSHAANQPPLH